MGKDRNRCHNNQKTQDRRGMRQHTDGTCAVQKRVLTIMLSDEY